MSPGTRFWKTGRVKGKSERKYRRPMFCLKKEIAFENMFQSGFKQRYCSETDEIIELVDSFREELVGVCWDTGHGALGGQSQGASIRKIGQRLKAMHVNDNHAIPKQDEHLMPFYGTIDWLEIMEALGAIGYDHDFAYELKQATQTLPPELCGKMLRFLYRLGMDLIERSVCRDA